MAVVISEIVTEIVVSPREPAAGTAAGAELSPEAMDTIVRRASERVLEVLRREWDR